MFCTECGTQSAENANLCLKCGFNFASDGRSPSKVKQKKSIITVIVFALSIVLFGVGTTTFYFASKSQSPSSQQTSSNTNSETIQSNSSTEEENSGDGNATEQFSGASPNLIETSDLTCGGYGLSAWFTAENKNSVTATTNFTVAWKHSDGVISFTQGVLMDLLPNSQTRVKVTPDTGNSVVSYSTCEVAEIYVY